MARASQSKTADSRRGAEIEVGYPVIDADSHMLEPFGMWAERIEMRYHDQLPRVVMDYKGRPGKWAVIGNFSMRISRDTSGAPESNEGGGGFDPEMRRGGWDPAARIKDMEIDGVAATALYPTYGLHMFGTQDEGLQRALFTAYNDWLSEFCKFAPSRFIGLGLVSLWDIDKGVEELERCKQLGLRGALIWGTPPDENPYFMRDYDKLWGAAHNLNMPLHLHLGAYAHIMRTLSPEHAGNWGAMYTEMIQSNTYLQRSLMHMIFGGVFERFSNLKIVIGEADIGWVPSLMERADRYYGSRMRRGHEFQLSQQPSDYLREQVWHTFIMDPFGLKTYQMAGLTDRIMWSTDYPHDACTFPNSLKIMTDDFSDVSAKDKRSILHDNVSQLYGLTLG